MKSTGTMMGSIKSTCNLLLLVSLLLSLADSYTNTDFPSMGCEECSLRRRGSFKDIPIFQCMGCCFSRAYPTPLVSWNTMNERNKKNITSEATCCVANNFTNFLVGGNIELRNHTECHCSTCYHHKT